jgi:hypothetical protein
MAVRPRHLEAETGDHRAEGKASLLVGLAEDRWGREEGMAAYHDHLGELKWTCQHNHELISGNTTMLLTR